MIKNFWGIVFLQFCPVDRTVANILGKFGSFMYYVVCIINIAVNHTVQCPEMFIN